MTTKAAGRLTDGGHTGGLTDVTGAETTVRSAKKGSLKSTQGAWPQNLSGHGDSSARPRTKGEIHFVRHPTRHRGASRLERRGHPGGQYRGGVKRRPES